MRGEEERRWRGEVSVGPAWEALKCHNFSHPAAHTGPSPYPSDLLIAIQLTSFAASRSSSRFILSRCSCAAGTSSFS